MPITLNPVDMAVRNENGYTGVNVVAQQKTSEMIEAIQQKGSETLASIPPDYTDLKAQIGELDSKMGWLGVAPIASYQHHYGHLTNNNTWNNLNANYQHIVVPVNGGDVLVTSFSTTITVGFVRSYTAPVDGASVDYSTQDGFTTKITTFGKTEKTTVIPGDVHFVIVENIMAGVDNGILKFEVNGYDAAGDQLGKIVGSMVKGGVSYAGNMQSLGYTSFVQCTKRGYYNFSSEYASTITDKPADLEKGGIIEVYPDFASSVVAQIITDSLGERWFRWGPRKFVKMSDGIETIPVTWEIGAIVSSTGANANSTTRVRTTTYTVIPLNGITVHVPHGMKLIAVGYSSDGQTVHSTAWHTDDFALYRAHNIMKYRFFGGFTDDRIITSADVGNMLSFDSSLTTRNGAVWYALGDSITEGYFSYNDGADKIEVTHNCWVSEVARKNGYGLVNFGVGGSGYATNGTQWGKQDAVTLVNSINFANCDFVTIAWGINDWKSNKRLETIKANMGTVIEKILNDNPKCKIFVVTPLNCRNTTKDYGTFETNWGLGYALSTSGTLQQVFDAIAEVAEYYGIEVIDMTHNSVVNRVTLPSALVDGVHPSKDVHLVLGAELAKKINYK